jgi:hypothetical protein
MSPKCPSGWPEKAALIRTSPSRPAGRHGRQPGQNYLPDRTGCKPPRTKTRAPVNLPRTLAEAQPAGVVKELAHAFPSPRALVGRAVGADERLRTYPRIWIMRIDPKTYAPAASGAQKRIISFSNHVVNTDTVLVLISTFPPLCSCHPSLVGLYVVFGLSECYSTPEPLIFSQRLVRCNPSVTFQPY